MSIGDMVARIRAEYHLACIDINDALYQLKIVDGDKTEDRQKKHTMAIFNDPRLIEAIAKMKKQ
jgi:hypothetical protein